MAKRLDDVAEVVMGQSPPGEMCNSHAGNGLPLLNGPTEFGAHHPEPVQFTSAGKKFSHCGDVLFCVRGSTTGRMNWSDQTYTIGRGIAAIRHKQTPALQPLVRAAIESYLPALLQSATGSTFPNVSAAQLAAIPFPDLDRTDEEAISALLAALEGKIETNNQMNRSLEAIARAIFKDWFVDFGPTRAKLEGTPPPALSIELAELFPEALDDEDKPAGWESVAVRELVDFDPAERIPAGAITSYLDMAALPKLGSWPDWPIPRPFAAGSKFRNGDALLARITPCLENGKSGFIQCLNDGEVGCGSTEFIVMRTREPLPAAYGYLLCRDQEFREHAIRSMTGTSGRQRVQVDSLSDYRVIRPSEAVSRAFGDIVQPWFDMIRANSHEVETLATLRNLLLPKLLSGEIRLKEAEHALEAVL